MENKTILRQDENVEAMEVHDANGDALLQRTLDEAENRLKKMRLALSEAEADLAYVRRRAQEDVWHAQKYAVEGFARALLAVKDNLETARSLETHDHRAYLEGIELVHKQLGAAFQAFGLHEINPQIGQAFDPSKHRATAESLDNTKEGIVAGVRTKGYRIGDRLLRPALVALSVSANAAFYEKGM